MGVFNDAGGLTGSQRRRVQRQLRWSRRALWAESIARAFWPVFVVVCLAGATALLGGFGAMGPLAHRILIGVFVLCLAATLVLGGLWFRRPGPAAAADRLDQEDTRRPLATLRDDLAVGRGTQDSETVWRAHRDRVEDPQAADHHRMRPPEAVVEGTRLVLGHAATRGRDVYMSIAR